MKFYSHDFDDYQSMDISFSGEGQDLVPSFSIEEVPEGTKSLALTVHDPDSPGETEWTHWLMWDIPPTTREISSSKIPKGTQGVNDFGNKGYGGPMPGKGTGKHRYIFSLYALDKELKLPESTNREKLISFMMGHILGQSMWVGTYERT